MTRRPQLALVLVLALGAATACRKKPEPAPEPVATTNTADADAAARGRAEEEAARRRADSLDAARRAADAAGSRASAAALATLQERIYFDYDQDALRDDARNSLDAKAAVLAANPNVSLMISGHTDERGTAEYNLALGQRRAAQVKRYLVSKGIPDGRLDTQSLGDSQPAATGSDESSYQQNRRAEFEVRGASGALTPPRS